MGAIHLQQREKPLLGGCASSLIQVQAATARLPKRGGGEGRRGEKYALVGFVGTGTTAFYAHVAYFMMLQTAQPGAPTPAPCCMQVQGGKQAASSVVETLSAPGWYGRCERAGCEGFRRRFGRFVGVANTASTPSPGPVIPNPTQQWFTMCFSAWPVRCNGQ